MKQLLLLVHGSSLEEMKANMNVAMEDVVFEYASMGERANAIADGYEYEFVDAKYLADAYLRRDK